MNIESALSGTAIFLSIFTGGCEKSPENDNREFEKPNIIYILADDLGYGDLGSYGQKNILTPNLNRMAEEGMRFTSHYSGSTVCAPSRAVLMTGLHTGHAPIRGNKGIMPIGQYPLQYGTVTFPKILKEAGYATGAFGKWGLGPPDSEGTPSLQGFDRFFGLLCQRRSHFFYPEFLFNVETGKPAERIYLEGNKVKDASREGFERPGSGPPLERGQYSADLDKLEEFGIENTLVIFTSDNGSYSEGGYHYSMHNSNAPLRGGKRDLYEGGIRVPMLAWWPGKIQPGTVSDHISGFQDIMPTFAELAGKQPPPQIDGISMVPTLLGREDQRKHDYLYWEFHEIGGRQAVRMGKWKGVRLNVRENRYSPIELYNLEEDIAEQNNLATQHPDIVSEIDRIMKEAHVPSMLFPLFEEY